MNKLYTKIALISLAIFNSAYSMDSKLIPLIDDTSGISKQLVIDLFGDTFTKTADGSLQFDFNCDAILLSILKFTLEVNSVFNKCDLDKKLLFDSFLRGIKKERFDQTLSIEQLISFAHVVQKFLFQESMLDVICYLIAEKAVNVELQIDKSNCSEKILIKILSYYYLLNLEILPGQTNETIAQALSFSEDLMAKYGSKLREKNSWQFRFNKFETAVGVFCECANENTGFIDLRALLKHIQKNHPERILFDYCEHHKCSAPYVKHEYRELHDTLFHSQLK